MAKRSLGIGREKARAVLGLAVGEVELAAETGLLLRLPDRTFDPLSVRAALDDLDGLRRRLAQERRCNATKSAARLGISVQRFKRVAMAAGLAPVAEKDVRKYGKVLHVAYYRAGDVDALADHLDRRKPAADAGQIEVLTWALALMRASGGSPGPLNGLGHLDDPGIEQLARVMRRARLRRRETEAMVEDVLPRAVRAAEDLADPAEVSGALGVPAWAVAEHVPHVGGHVPGAALRELAEEPPSWLLRARADIELRNALMEVERRTPIGMRPSSTPLPGRPPASAMPAWPGCWPVRGRGASAEARQRPLEERVCRAVDAAAPRMVGR
jgi:hypothetical protein